MRGTPGIVLWYPVVGTRERSTQPARSMWERSSGARVRGQGDNRVAHTVPGG